MVIDATIEVKADEVEPQLYIGSYDAACSWDDLKAQEIRFILNCGYGLKNQFPQVVPMTVALIVNILFC